MAGSDQLKWIDMGREALAVEECGLAAVRGRLGAGFAVAVELLAGCRGRAVVTGVGKSGLVGRKIAATFSSVGAPAFFLHPVEAAHGDLGMVREADVVLAISNSGETDEVNAIVPRLKGLGAKIIALTGGPDSTLARSADAVIDCGVPKEACPLGLAPTASTTAALAVGDALAVCLIDAKGFRETDFQRYHPGGALGARLKERVDRLMRSGDLPIVGANATLGEALAVMNAGKIGAVLAVENDRLAGIFTDGDLRRVVAAGKADLSRPLADVMVVAPLTASPTDSAAKALDLMEAKAITVLPVVAEGKDGKLVGVLHLHDVLGQGRVKFSG